MNPISSYHHRYRLHQAYSRYPRLAMLTDITKSACFIGIVAAVSWLGFSVVTQDSRAPARTSSVAVAAQTSQNHIAFTQTQNVHEQPVSTPLEVPAATRPEGASVNSNIPLAVISDTQLSSPKVEIPASAAVTLALGDQKKIHESDWIFLLPADKFIIQFGSSPDWERIYADAKAFPTGPVAIYPFKKTPTNRIVYGYSSGIYNSLDEARRAIDTLPKSIVANGPWIRPVGALKKQIMNLSVES